MVALLVEGQTGVLGRLRRRVGSGSSAPAVAAAPADAHSSARLHPPPRVATALAGHLLRAALGACRRLAAAALAPVLVTLPHNPLQPPQEQPAQPQSTDAAAEPGQLEHDTPLRLRGLARHERAPSDAPSPAASSSECSWHSAAGTAPGADARSCSGSMRSALSTSCSSIPSALSSRTASAAALVCAEGVASSAIDAAAAPAAACHRVQLPAPAAAEPPRLVLFNTAAARALADHLSTLHIELSEDDVPWG